ncbi:putative transcription factor bHLH family [Helianthus annuus]|uniref:Transcription factor bHLH family n=1 Tax=Helianthus annuus TaxID=4232 RepID=A0A9K3J4J5_HELAN|nr:putative transcription factor bHLH family [Helianthus annuus]KAJ0579451.1 putative transcription factor bHLH family [Helianthus annuus]KAJ0595337.1 putative transcription factor bHLH family [Helianthus annuus]KAJ0929490.1 putative transcription factor bHLH family [Helianthus annuus]
MQPDYYPYPSYPVVQDVTPMEEMQPELLPPLPEIYDGGGSSTAVPSPVRGNLYSGVGFNATQGEERSVQMKENSDGRGRVSAQSMAARVRRRKISEKTSELGKLVPGGHRMTTAEMFQAAFKYIKFLQAQVGVLEQMPSSPVFHYLIFSFFSCFSKLTRVKGPKW